ncbi:hypothetical protein BLA29_000132 [Euroglyphus maynei]|uniref:Uncharacterized protein n=1 Tax=Euroglyphus maynei TaxID=6958 RepID=A0A1Y3AVU6_EURMA|nr:hypothetical protein BLA29_000132 [Euroglyphus maynei]
MTTTTTTAANTSIAINNGNISISNNNNIDQQQPTNIDSTKNIVDDITSKELGDLLNFFSSSSSSPYRNRDNNINTITGKIEEKCIDLISKDYSKYIVIKNDKGQLSTSYPSKIVIPEIEIINSKISYIDDDEKYSTTSNNNQVPINNDEVDNLIIANNDNNVVNGKLQNQNQEKFDVNKLKDLIKKARVARCRARFPIPAILYKNKYICRSATLSSVAEIFGRSVLDYTFNDSKNYTTKSNVENVIETIDNDDDDFIKANHIENESPPSSATNTLNIADSTKLFTHFRNQDIKLLKYLNVKLICDLMLEKKKVKFGMNVTSSEKADKKNRYSDFNILSLPYPGCEFFREYRDNSYSGEGLIYDWNQDFVDAEFGFDNSNEISRILNLNFNEYRSWDVIRLTQNYIKLMLYFLKKFDSSLLIHCISGWDRTPLFISLLRLTLWADGEIHKSLNAVEICYLTVAYDWLLFGHNLNDRLNKGEEIMFFCFQFLKFITDDEFSIDQIQSEQTITNGCNNNDEEKISRKISTDSFTLYEDFVIENIPNNIMANTSNGSIGSSSSLLNRNNNKPEDSYSLVSTFEFEQQTTNIKDDQRNNSIKSIESNDDDDDDDISMPIISSQPPEMIATLTLDDVDDTVNHFGSPPRRNDNLFKNSDLHSSTQPVQIPNANNNNNHHHHHQSDQSHSLSNDSLCRSDSWQFVSEASSIIDNHSILNQHFSSPESFSSLVNNNDNKSKKSPLNINQNPSSNISTIKTNNNYRLKKRSERLLEVRSLFNSAYMSINFHHNNGGSGGGNGLVTNFMDQLCRTVNI